MVKAKYTASEIRKIVKTLVDILTENKITVDKIILYGSYANGNSHDHSNIDIAVISPSFKGKKILKIQEKLAKIRSSYLSIIEPVGYSSDNYQTAEPETLLGEIKRSGKILYPA